MIEELVWKDNSTNGAETRFVRYVAETPIGKYIVKYDGDSTWLIVTPFGSSYCQNAEHGKQLSQAHYWTYSDPSYMRALSLHIAERQAKATERQAAALEKIASRLSADEHYSRLYAGSQYVDLEERVSALEAQNSKSELAESVAIWGAEL